MLEKIDQRLRNVYFPDFSIYKKLFENNGIQLISADPFAPDACLPDHIIGAVKKALDDGKTHYSNFRVGEPGLAEEITKKLKAFNKMEIDPHKELLVTPGSALALFMAIRLCVTPNAGDEVLNHDPGFAENFNDVYLAGAENVCVPIYRENNWQLDVNELEKHVTPRTKAIIITNPNNPTSTVQTKRTLLDIAKFVKKHDLLVIVDQSFEQLVYDEKEFITFAALPDMRERTLTVYSFSKDMGLSGFRIGYLVASEEYINILERCMYNYAGLPNTFSQYGVIAGLKNYQFVENWKEIYDRRRKRSCEILSQVKGVECDLPEAGFFLWVDIRKLGSSEELVKYLIEEANVGVAPGFWFGKNGEGFLRIMFGGIADDNVYFRAIERCASALKKKAENKGIYP
jgi:aspartate/methionine/tyrosine aminotransferase